VRDLGTLIDDHLKFHDHTTMVSKKANHLLAVNHNTFDNFHRNTFLSLYKSYIRSVEFIIFIWLEYRNIVWGPQYVLDQRQIEKIQKSTINWFVIFKAVHIMITSLHALIKSTIT